MGTTLEDQFAVVTTDKTRFTLKRCDGIALLQVCGLTLIAHKLSSYSPLSYHLKAKENLQRGYACWFHVKSNREMDK